VSQVIREEKPVGEMTEKERAAEIEEIDYRIMALLAEKAILEIVPGLIEGFCKEKGLI